MIRPPGQQRGGPVRLPNGGDLLWRERRGRGQGLISWYSMTQLLGTSLFGSRNGIAAVCAAHVPPSGATISRALPGSASAIGTQT